MNELASGQLWAIGSCRGIPFAGGPGVDPDFTWLPELLGCHPVPLAILRVLLMHGLTHPLQAVVTEEPLWGEKREMSGALSAQPLPGEKAASAQPPASGLRSQPTGWGDGPGGLGHFLAVALGSHLTSQSLRLLLVK